MHVDLVRILGRVDLEIRRLPLRERRRHVLHDEAEVVDDGTGGRREGCVCLAQHDVNAGELDEFERTVRHHRPAHDVDPEPLLRVDIGHREVHVSHPQPDLVRLDELCERRTGVDADGRQEREVFHHGGRHPATLTDRCQTRTRAVTGPNLAALAAVCDWVPFEPSSLDPDRPSRRRESSGPANKKGGGCFQPPPCASPG